MSQNDTSELIIKPFRVDMQGLPRRMPISGSGGDSSGREIPTGLTCFLLPYTDDVRRNKKCERN